MLCFHDSTLDVKIAQARGVRPYDEKPIEPSLPARIPEKITTLSAETSQRASLGLSRSDGQAKESKIRWTRTVPRIEWGNSRETRRDRTRQHSRNYRSLRDLWYLL